MRTLVLAIGLASCPCAFALDPTLDVNQYTHTAWKVRDGFVQGAINAIVQTPDGYIWLGTEFELLRFDGVRTVPFQPPPDQQLPSNWIFTLLAARDGTLWIGTEKGLVSWKDGKLTHFPELDGQYIFSLLEDREGSIWIGGGAVTATKLCVVRKGRTECTEDSRFGFGVFGLYEDSQHGLWLGLTNSIWRLKPEPRKVITVPGPPDTYGTFFEQADGTLLVSTRSGIQRLVDDKLEPYAIPGAPVQFFAQAMVLDRDGAFWIGTTRGLLHVHNGRTDSFTQADGLSGDAVREVFEDREGNIWVATDSGLDRFRASAVTTLSASQGSWTSNVYSALAASDGSIWFGSSAGLNRWQNGQVTVYRARGASPVTGARVVFSLPEGGFTSIFEDRRGRIWVSSNERVGYLEAERFVTVRGIPGGNVRGFAEDTTGNIWIADQTAGLIRVRPDLTSEAIPWVKLGHQDFAGAIAGDPVRGGLWMGFFLGGISYFADGQVRESYAAASGLGAGAVYNVRVDAGGSVWTSTESGLSRLNNGRIATLSSRNGLPCDGVQWMVEDDAGSSWLKTTCGLARVARTDLASWIAAVDEKGSLAPTIPVTVFDNADGVRSRATPTGYSPQVAKSADGRLWFVPLDGVSVLDPRRIPFNTVPPPVHIEQVIVDRKIHSSAAEGRPLGLPPLTRDLQFDYTALSFVAPERVLFRYVLEGWDREWQEVGTRRQAFYNNLPPGNYRFRVTASNNSGVWNESGAYLDFAVAPAYYQTVWFRSAVVGAFLLLVAGMYQLRLRQVSRDYNLRLEARVSERTRIARDFHDTLLQSFQGVLLKFHAVTYLLPDQPGEARGKLETIVEQARQAIAEGRDAVQGLRSPLVINDLADAISTLGKELVSGHDGKTAPAFVVDVEGTPRDLVPPIRDEVYRIACEALRNAFRHAQAKRIEMEIRYDQRQLQVRVRDDGRGIDTKRAEGVARHGHFGLAGMRERAELAGGTLAVWSERDSGTEIELTIPASVAYTSSSIARRWLFGKAGATKR